MLHVAIWCAMTEPDVSFWHSSSWNLWSETPFLSPFFSHKSYKYKVGFQFFNPTLPFLTKYQRSYQSVRSIPQVSNHYKTFFQRLLCWDNQLFIWWDGCHKVLLLHLLLCSSVTSAAFLALHKLNLQTPPLTLLKVSVFLFPFLELVSFFCITSCKQSMGFLLGNSIEKF